MVARFYKDKKIAFEKVNLLSAFETVTLFAEDTFNETPLSYTNPQVYLLNRGFVERTQQVLN